MYISIAKDVNTGDIKFINDVERGEKCNCLCLGCDEPLIAKKGKIVTHHFAHKSGAERAACSETALHFMGKMTFAKLLEFRPARIASLNRVFKSILGAKFQEPKFYEPGIFDVGNIRIEKRRNEYVPDIICDITAKNGKVFELAVEIVVTHRCSEVKIEQIQRDDLSTIEIDLSALLNDPILLEDNVSSAIFDHVNHEWVHVSDELMAFVSAWDMRNLQENIDLQNEKDTKLIESVKKSIIEIGKLETPEYPYSQHIRDDIAWEYAKLCVDEAPSRSATMNVDSVVIEDGYFLIGVDVGGRKGSIRLYFGDVGEDWEGKTHLKLANSLLFKQRSVLSSKAFDPSDVMWGFCEKADNYIRAAKVSVKEERDRLIAERLVEEQKERDKINEMKARVESMVSAQDFPRMKNVEAVEALSDALVVYMRSVSKFKDEMIAREVSKCEVFGCSNETWQKLAIYILTEQKGELFNAKKMVDQLSGRWGVKMPSVLSGYLKSVDDVDERVIPSSFKVIYDFFLELQKKGFGELKGEYFSIH